MKLPARQKMAQAPKLDLGVGGSPEWRIFFKPKSKDFNIFKTLNLGYAWGPEERPDDYIALTNDSFGLKARAGKRLELKTRTKLTGEIEYWAKTRYKGFKEDKPSLATIIAFAVN